MSCMLLTKKIPPGYSDGEGRFLYTCTVQHRQYRELHNFNYGSPRCPTMIFTLEME